MKILSNILFAIVIIGISVFTSLSVVDQQSTPVTVSGGGKNYSPAINELTERADSLDSALLRQETEISSQAVEIASISEYNRSFVTTPDPDTKYHLFSRSCGTFKIVAMRSGDNYIDFYDSTDAKISNLTYNLSKNDSLIVTFYEYGKRVSFSKFHDGSNVSTKDYIASSTETLSYLQFANSEVFITIS